LLTPSDFRVLFQPSYCERRVWLEENKPELAIEDVEFKNLVVEKGQGLEKNHVDTLGPVEMPIYEPTDFPLGFEETLNLINHKTPIIYQGVLISKDNKLLAIPDLLIYDRSIDQYIVRDVKLAVNLDNHPEIQYGLGLTTLIAAEILGYIPIIEVASGDGNVISDLTIPDNTEVICCLTRIQEIQNMDREPYEPVGWSKCGECSFFNYCWNEAWNKQDISTIPAIEQGMAKVLISNGIKTWQDIIKIGIPKLAEIQFPRGKSNQKIGVIRSEKIVRQALCITCNRFEKMAELSLPQGYVKGQRPIVIFDIENNIFDVGIQVNVYLWGLMIVNNQEQTTQILIVSDPGECGDREGWKKFLGQVSKIFKKYGDVPIIHYGSHEKTWVKNYISRYGDQDDIGDRIMNNMWDMYTNLTKCVTLPIPSYGLKQIEKFIGFKRTQEEYGGSWSIVKYNQYISSPSKEEAEEIIDQIRTYNGEDLLATYLIYKWLEDNI